jgi:hypothetical protein
LRDLAKPIGVAEWQTRLVQSLPEHLRGSLPTIAELEAELLNKGTKDRSGEAETAARTARPATGAERPGAGAYTFLLSTSW